MTQIYREILGPFHWVETVPNPRLWREYGSWYCAVGGRERRVGPIGRGLTPRAAYEVWFQELRR